MSVLQDNYIAQVINKYKTNIGFIMFNQQLNRVLSDINTVVNGWSNGYLERITYSGSYAKGTATSLSTDLDLFISLKPTTPDSLSKVYNSLHTAMANNNYAVRKQNVSIGLTHQGFKIDLVPAVRQSIISADHSLFVSKRNTWTKTNVNHHINLIKNSRRSDEMKAAKIWRSLHNLDFPSFYLELTVLDALRGRNFNQLGTNFLTVLEYLSRSFANARVVDPANTNNIISDDLSAQQKQAISNAASQSLRQQYLKGIIW